MVDGLVVSVVSEGRWAALVAFRELSGLEKRWEGTKLPTLSFRALGVWDQLNKWLIQKQRHPAKGIPERAEAERSLAGGSCRAGVCGPCSRGRAETELLSGNSAAVQLSWGGKRGVLRAPRALLISGALGDDSVLLG